MCYVFVCCTDISVETIAEFNKMKCLTSDISLVVQVMKKSELVEVQSVTCDGHNTVLSGV